MAEVIDRLDSVNEVRASVRDGALNESEFKLIDVALRVVHNEDVPRRNEFALGKFDHFRLAAPHRLGSDGKNKRHRAKCQMGGAKKEDVDGG